MLEVTGAAKALRAAAPPTGGAQRAGSGPGSGPGSRAALAPLPEAPHGGKAGKQQQEPPAAAAPAAPFDWPAHYAASTLAAENAAAADALVKVGLRGGGAPQASEPRPTPRPSASCTFCIWAQQTEHSPHPDGPAPTNPPPTLPQECIATCEPLKVSSHYAAPFG
jgi:hypothetical protein